MLLGSHCTAGHPLYCWAPTVLPGTLFTVGIPLCRRNPLHCVEYESNGRESGKWPQTCNRTRVNWPKAEWMHPPVTSFIITCFEQQRVFGVAYSAFSHQWRQFEAVFSNNNGLSRKPTGVIWSVCGASSRRFDPSLRTLYKKRAEVGQLQMVKSCARDAPFPPLDYLKISGELCIL